jgi:hypothetical protein
MTGAEGTREGTVGAMYDGGTDVGTDVGMYSVCSRLNKLEGSPPQHTKNHSTQTALRQIKALRAATGTPNNHSKNQLRKITPVPPDPHIIAVSALILAFAPKNISSSAGIHL